MEEWLEWKLQRKNCGMERWRHEPESTIKECWKDGGVSLNQPSKSAIDMRGEVRCHHHWVRGRPRWNWVSWTEVRTSRGTNPLPQWLWKVRKLANQESPSCREGFPWSMSRVCSSRSGSSWLHQRSMVSLSRKVKFWMRGTPVMLPVVLYSTVTCGGFWLGPLFCCGCCIVSKGLGEEMFVWDFVDLWLEMNWRKNDGGWFRRFAGIFSCDEIGKREGKTAWLNVTEDWAKWKHDNIFHRLSVGEEREWREATENNGRRLRWRMRKETESWRTRKVEEGSCSF